VSATGAAIGPAAEAAAGVAAADAFAGGSDGSAACAPVRLNFSCAPVRLNFFRKSHVYFAIRSSGACVSPASSSRTTCKAGEVEPHDEAARIVANVAIAAPHVVAPQVAFGK
jgi:hypothetical protein